MDWNRHQRGQIDVGTDHIKTRESPDGWRRNLGSFFEFAFGHFLGLSNLGLGSEFVKVGVQKWQFPETSKKCQFDVFFAIWPNSGFRVKFDQILGSMDPWWPEVKTPNSASCHIGMYLTFCGNCQNLIPDKSDPKLRSTSNISQICRGSARHNCSTHESLCGNFRSIL